LSNFSGVIAMPSLNHSQVRQFVAVAEHRNFGRAAEALGLSQQAVSKNVALLEGRLRARLLERGRFGAIPTVYGEALLRRAKSAEAELRLGLAEIEALRGASVGSVRVGVERVALARGGRKAQEATKKKAEGLTRFGGSP